jgi:K+-sensing histidine kinase KdpD
MNKKALGDDLKKIQIVSWFGIALIILIADYFAGPFIQFPFTYLLPVALASYFSGLFWGLALAVIMPLVRWYFNIALWTIPWTYVEASINGVIRITVFSLFAVLIDRLASQNRRLSVQVDMLSGLLPICANCKKIRNESNEWEEIETYITNKTDAEFTHGICPECKQQLYGPELLKLRQKTQPDRQL